MAARDKVISAAEAVALIRDGDTIVVEGFCSHCFAEELTVALEERFLQSGTPRDLSMTFTVALSERGLAPHIYESRQEALDWLPHA